MLTCTRYDCRGHLYDKAQFGLKPNLPRRWNAEEEAFEELLDRERYMALDTDLREEDFRKGVYVCLFVVCGVCVHACVHACVYVYSASDNNNDNVLQRRKRRGCLSQCTMATLQ